MAFGSFVFSGFFGGLFFYACQALLAFWAQRSMLQKFLVCSWEGHGTWSNHRLHIVCTSTSLIMRQGLSVLDWVKKTH